ncbi:MAG: hypothetical protein ACP5I3_11180 [Thermoproteus sp.]
MEELLRALRVQISASRLAPGPTTRGPSVALIRYTTYRGGFETRRGL